MSDNLTVFIKNISDFIDIHVPKAVQAFHQKLALQALEGVVDLTRVDTGNARGGWQVLIGDLSQVAETVEDQSGSGTISRGASIIATAEPYSVIFLANAVHYIRYLNDGTSRMGGDFMIEQTINDLLGQFK